MKFIGILFVCLLCACQTTTTSQANSSASNCADWLSANIPDAFFWPEATPQTVEACISQGADVNARLGGYSNSPTPLHAAIQYGQGNSVPIVRTLIRNGADVNAVRGDSRNLLRQSLSYDDVPAFFALLDAGAEPTDYNLFDAIDADSVSAVRAVLASGVSPDTYRGGDGLNALHFAMIFGKSEGPLLALLDAGARLDLEPGYNAPQTTPCGLIREGYVSDEFTISQSAEARICG